MVKKISVYFYTALLAVTLAGIVSSVLLQVIFRYVFNSPLMWTDEFSRLSFAWYTFIGAALASHDDKHLEVKFFFNKFPEKVKKIVNIFNHILIFVFSCLLLYSTFIQIILVRNIRSFATRMPMVFFTIPIFIGFLGIAYYSLSFSIKFIKEVNNA